MSGDAATTNKQWFVIHTYSGFENKVSEAIQSRAKIFGMGEKIARVLVPTEKVVEVRTHQEHEPQPQFLHPVEDPLHGFVKQQFLCDIGIYFFGLKEEVVENRNAATNLIERQQVGFVPVIEVGSIVSDFVG